MTQQTDLDAAIKAARRILELDKQATRGPWLARPRETPLFTGGVTVETVHHDPAWLDKEIFVKVGVQKDRGPENYYEPITERNRANGNFAAESRTLAPLVARALLSQSEMIDALTRACNVALDALGCDRLHQDRLEAQRIIKSAIE